MTEPELPFQDTTISEMTVGMTLLEKLGKAITYAEEALQAGEMSVDTDEFFDRRGNFLDILQDQQIAEFLRMMRNTGKVPFRSYAVKD